MRRCIAEALLVLMIVLSSAEELHATVVPCPGYRSAWRALQNDCDRVILYYTYPDDVTRYFRWGANPQPTIRVVGTPPTGVMYPNACVNTTLADQVASALVTWRTAPSSLGPADRSCVPKPDGGAVLSAGSLVDGESYVRWVDNSEFCVADDNVPAVATLLHTNNGTIVAAGIQLRKQTWAESSEPFGWYQGTVPAPGTTPEFSLYVPTILSHELGHWLAVDHGLCGGSVMYGVIATESTINTYPQLHELMTIDWLCEQDVAGASETANYTIILVPGSFLVTGIEGAIELYWENDRPVSTNVFKISRADACNGPYRDVTVVPHSGAESYTWVDESVEDDRVYWYRIHDSEDGLSAYGGAAALDLPPTNPPGSPAAVEVAALVNGGAENVTLTWAAVPGASSYYVYQLQPGGDCEGPSGFVDSTVATSYVLPGAHVNYPTEFGVRATSATGVSGLAGSAYACVDADVTISDNAVTMCPAGDRDSLVVTAQLRLGCGLNIGTEIPGIMLVRRSDSDTGVAFARDLGNGQVAYSDTLRPMSYDAQSGLAVFKVNRGSGCGVWRGDLWADGKRLLSSLEVTVRSFDQDSHARGAVDRFDNSAFDAALIAGSPGCWDLNWSGGAANSGDHSLLSVHAIGRHHLPRKLLTPNGGNVFSPGDVVPITWQRGLGDSARVTLRALLPPVDTTVIATDIPDSGTYNWTIPMTNRAGANWRMQVLHSAGYYKVDYRDVGTDKSDTTITFRANPVADLAAIAGRHSAALSWSDPIQGTVTAEQHDIHYRMSTPLTEANCDEAPSVAVMSPPAPSTVGTEHCLEIDTLTPCRTYYFAMKTKASGVWSKMSSVVTVSTQCSGFSEATCEYGGLMAGGGDGGGGESAMPMSLSAAANRPVSVTGEEFPENSVLGGLPAGTVDDLYRLPAAESGFAAAPIIVVREAAARQVEIDAVGLGTVDHPVGTEAVAGLSSVLVGSISPVQDVLTSDGSSVTALLNPIDGSGMTIRSGDALTVQLGGDFRNAALVVDSKGRPCGVRGDSLGILVQRADRSGRWVTLAQFNPRRAFDRHGIASEGAGVLRLVFLKDYELRSLGHLGSSATVTPEPLTITNATQSRVGAVDDAVGQRGGAKATLAAGDTMQIRFSPRAAAPGMQRSHFLTIRGSVLAASSEQASSGETSLAMAGAPTPEFALEAARPNPSTGSALIAYALASDVRAELAIYDVSGRRVRTLVSADRQAGRHEELWDGRDEGGRTVPAGVYFYRLRAGDWRSERKLIVLQR